MSTAIAELEQRQASEESKAAAAYENLVAAVAAEEDFDSKVALKVLRDAGKSTTQLQTDADRLNKISALREQIAGIPSRQQELKQLRQQITAKGEELEAAKKRIAAEIKSLEDAEINVSTKINQLEFAKRELRDLVPPSQEVTELKRELKTLVHQIAKLELATHRMRDPRELEREVTRLKDELVRRQSEFESRVDREGDAAIFPAYIRGLERELAELQQRDGRRKFFERLDAAKKRQADLQAQLAAAQAKQQ